MKRALIIGLAILKVAVVETSEAKASPWLEQVFQKSGSEQVRQAPNGQQVPKTPAQVVESKQPTTQSATEKTALERTPFSERDPEQISEAARLIKERFLIKIIPAQNQ